MEYKKFYTPKHTKNLLTVETAPGGSAFLSSTEEVQKDSGRGKYRFKNPKRVHIFVLSDSDIIIGALLLLLLCL